jgi:hypothetical protein
VPQSNSCLPYFDTYLTLQYLLILHVKRENLAWLQLATGLHIYINQWISILASRWLQLRPAACNTGRTPGPAWVWSLTICAPYCKARQATFGVVEAFGVWRMPLLQQLHLHVMRFRQISCGMELQWSILATCCATEDFCCHLLYHFQFLGMYYLCLWKLKWTMDGCGTSPGHLGTNNATCVVLVTCRDGIICCATAVTTEGTECAQ